jgi:hydrogenase nickel incorporation protein HypA/HybF
MHELGITQQVLEIAVDKATEAGAQKVKYIDLVIGDMSGFLCESVQFYFDFLANGTVASGAQLRFRHIPIEVRCRHCSRKFFPEGDKWNCPDCGERDVEILTGKEFYLESLEVEQ